MKPTIFHLVDPHRLVSRSSVGSFVTKAGIAHNCDNRILNVRIGRFSAPRLDGFMIISHLKIGWRHFPFILALRATNPSARIIQFLSTAYFAQHGIPTNSRLRGAFSLFDQLLTETSELARALEHEGLAAQHEISVLYPQIGLLRLLDMGNNAMPAPLFGRHKNGRTPA